MWIDRQLACFQIMKTFPPKLDLKALKLLQCPPYWIEANGERKHDDALQADRWEDVGDTSIVWGLIYYHDAFGKYKSTFGFRVLQDGRFERLPKNAEFERYNQSK
jgi:hypothetical protein